MNLTSKTFLFLLTNGALIYSCYNIKNAVNTADQLNYSPLFYAVQNKDITIATLLLEVNANPNRHAQEETPLNAAIRLQEEELVKLLLEHKADVNVANKKDGKTALHQAVEIHMNDNTRKKAILDLILEKNPNLALTNNDGDTALIIAIKNKRSDLVELLLADKENIRTSDDDSE
ncbi:ankyrin repeat domain-containing protein [Candidatus Dependentiae bacterium]|nr:MAG: ankyrin repeat domain-containing protein [Candidatus Dependentiae bacterium]